MEIGYIVHIPESVFNVRDYLIKQERANYVIRTLLLILICLTPQGKNTS